MRSASFLEKQDCGRRLLCFLGSKTVVSLNERQPHLDAVITTLSLLLKHFTKKTKGVL